MEKITAVVVTYNRFELLKRAVNSLRNQSRKLDNIIVVNNGCTDGTKEWLDAQTDLDVIHQENVGGSGGFYRGIQHAYEKAYDWIWCMDDDVYPEEKCLETLLRNVSDEIGILCPLRNMGGKNFITEIRRFNLSNPFKSLHVNKLSVEDVNDKETINIEGITFEGPLIRNKVVTDIGYPNKDLFLLYDDSDYGYRAVLAGYKIALVRDAVLFKEDFGNGESKENVIRKGKWKIYYHLRNTAYFNKRYGKNILVKYARSILLIIRYIFIVIYNKTKNNKYDWYDINRIIKAFIHGMSGRLGKY